MTDRQTYRTYLYMRPDIQDLRIYATSRRIKMDLFSDMINKGHKRWENVTNKRSSLKNQLKTVH